MSQLNNVRYKQLLGDVGHGTETPKLDYKKNYLRLVEDHSLNKMMVQLMKRLEHTIALYFYKGNSVPSLNVIN